MIGMQKDTHLRELQSKFQNVKNGQIRAKSNMQLMNNSMLNKNSSFYNERINKTHNETQQVNQTTELLRQ